MPFDKLSVSIPLRKFRKKHGGNPVLKWMAGFHPSKEV